MNNEVPAEQRKYKVSKEAAEEFLNEWFEDQDIDTDTDDMKEEEASSFSAHKKQLIRAIMKGHLIVMDDMRLKYTPHRPNSKNKESLVFHERTGADVMEADGQKKNREMARMHTILASLCKVHASVISGLSGSDYKTVCSIGVLLMA